MPIELELKVRVHSHDPVRQRLVSLAAEFVGTVIERNTMLDRSDGSLRASGCGLRVRSTTPLEGKNPGSKITFKGPARNSELKCREEIEVKVENADDAISVLQRLGFVQTVEYHKKRERWRLAGCVVELDELPRLGLFAEIEGPDEKSIRAAQEQLGLGECQHVGMSYVEMASRYCDQRNLQPRIVTW